MAAQPLASSAFEKATVPAGPINAIAEVFEDPQVQYRELKIDFPAEGIGQVAGLRTPITIDGQHAAHPRPAPGLDADRAGILSDPAWN